MSSQGLRTAELQSDVANLHSQLNMARQEAASSTRQSVEVHQARDAVPLKSLESAVGVSITMLYLKPVRLWQCPS